MARLTIHHRNHSFPPVPHIRPVDTIPAIKRMSAPLPHIDDEPWLYFLDDPGQRPSREEHIDDSLHQNAGILAGTEASKRKAHKFRPRSRRGSEESVHHHGVFQRRRSDWHGYVSNNQNPFEPSTPDYAAHDRMSASHPGAASQPRRRHLRHMSEGAAAASRHSSHRRSWQEPAEGITPVNEEDIPQIVVSDFDESHSEAELRLSMPNFSDLSLPVFESEEEYEPQSEPEAEQTRRGAESPKSPPRRPSINSPQLSASDPEDKPDAGLHQMWLWERARL